MAIQIFAHRSPRTVELVHYFIIGQTNMVVNKRLHCNDLPPISCCLSSTPLNRFLVQQGSIYVREATGLASQVDLYPGNQHVSTRGAAETTHLDGASSGRPLSSPFGRIHAQLNARSNSTRVCIGQGSHGKRRRQRDDFDEAIICRFRTRDIWNGIEASI